MPKVALFTSKCLIFFLKSKNGVIEIFLKSNILCTKFWEQWNSSLNRTCLNQKFTILLCFLRLNHVSRKPCKQRSDLVLKWTKESTKKPCYVENRVVRETCKHQEVFALWYYCFFIYFHLLLVQISELHPSSFLIK